MQTKLMKNLLLVLVITVLCFAVGMTASALDETGECGENVYWNFDSETGEIVISGEGTTSHFIDEESPFSYEPGIKSLVVSEGVTGIGTGTFRGCGNLENVEISESVTHIGNYAFMYCKSLANITLPANLAELGSASFAYCESLESVEFSDGSTDVVIGASAFSYCRSLKKVVLPERLTNIYSNLFEACVSLESIIIPDSVKSIHYGAFCGCINLKSVTLNKELSKILSSAFALCTSLEEIIIPGSVENIDSEVFSGCLSLEKLVISDGVKSIADGAFSTCVALKEVIIPESVAHIEDRAFESCVELEEVAISNKEAIFNGDNIFYTDYVYANGVTKEEFKDNWKAYYIAETNCLIAEVFNTVYPDEWSEEYYNKCEEEFFQCEEALMVCMEYYDEAKPISNLTLNGHTHSTTEDHAIKRNIPFADIENSEHPDIYFSNEWIYDYDNRVRYRVCTYTDCDVVVTEPLETTTDDDVEIIEPADPDTDFVVDVITDYVVIEETISNNIAGDFEIVKAFDITMKNKDGVHVQPDGTVKVKLPLDWSKDGIYKVYRVNDDGTLTDMEAYRQGSHMVFETDHFSVYVIVDESKKADTPAETPEEETKNDFFSKIIDWFKSLLDLIISWFKK